MATFEDEMDRRYDEGVDERIIARAELRDERERCRAMLVDACQRAADLLQDRYGIRPGEDTPSAAVVEACLSAVAAAKESLA